MLDSGLPLATESNILKELIKPPNIFRKVANLVTGDNTKYVKQIIYTYFSILELIIKTKKMQKEAKQQDYIYFSSISNTLPSSQLSNIPWRRMGVKYTNNEAYFDLIEEIDAIIDRNGATVMAEIQGYVSFF